MQKIKFIVLSIFLIFGIFPVWAAENETTGIHSVQESRAIQPVNSAATQEVTVQFPPENTTNERPSLRQRIEAKIRSFLPWKKAVPLTGWTALFTALCLTAVFSYKTFIPLYVISLLYKWEALWLPDGWNWITSPGWSLLILILAVLEVFWTLSLGSTMLEVGLKIMASSKNGREAACFVSTMFRLPAIISCLLICAGILSSFPFFLKWIFVLCLIFGFMRMMRGLSDNIIQNNMLSLAPIDIFTMAVSFILPIITVWSVGLGVTAVAVLAGISALLKFAFES